MPWLPNLHTVIFDGWRKGGVPVNLFEIAFLAPGLRSLNVMGQYVYYDLVARTYERLKDGTLAFHVPQLTELSWTRNMAVPIDYDENYWKYEEYFLAPVVHSIRHTVKKLLIPAETVYLDNFASFSWPSLLQLSLNGRIPLRTPDIWTAILSNLPRLETFSLLSPRRVELPRGIILCPAERTSNPNLDHLRSMTIAFPHPEDNIFDYLPRELDHLALRDCPRTYHDLAGDLPCEDLEWCFPILISTELAQIIRRCDFPGLRSLEIVYTADHQEFDTLELISTTFPALRILKLFRYYSDGDTSVDIVSSTIS